MNALSIVNAASMTSREIAELVESRHSDVKRSIERLVERGVISKTPTAFLEEISNLGLPIKREQYVFTGDIGKRDSIIVVAQLSPEFTARLVDRWRELESTQPQQIPQTLPEALRLAADLAEKNQQLANTLAVAQPKIEFAERVGEADGVLIGNYAKSVGYGPNKLFKWLHDNGVLINGGSRHNMPMQEYIDRGYFTVRQNVVDTNHGVKSTFTPKITGRGQMWLTHKLFDDSILKPTTVDILPALKDWQDVKRQGVFLSGELE